MAHPCPITPTGEYGSDAARIPWRVALDYIWFTEETLASPHFDEDGRHIGTFGAKEYSNRWASAWRDAVVKDKGGPNGKYYDILPMLKAFDSCQKCPKGVTASPWNGWGAFPVAAAFQVFDGYILEGPSLPYPSLPYNLPYPSLPFPPQVPLDGYSKDTMQQWTEFIAKVAFDGTTHAQYAHARMWRTSPLTPPPSARVAPPGPPRHTFLYMAGTSISAPRSWSPPCSPA